jgi:hypothetical protein
MKKFSLVFGVLLVIFILLSIVVNANAQQRETYTGTVLFYGSGLNTRTTTRQFTLIINSRTSKEQERRFLSVLRERGQDALLRTIDDNDLGRFSVGANVGVPINVVWERVENGRRHITVVFERWMQFAELRYGYRSQDYPFGYMELVIDERTGKGEGTYIAAARIRWDEDDGRQEVEIENFATFPARLMGVRRSTRNAR